MTETRMISHLEPLAPARYVARLALSDRDAVQRSVLPTPTIEICSCSLFRDCYTNIDVCM